MGDIENTEEYNINNDILIKDINDSYLDADLNTRYWSRLCNCYYHKDRTAKIFLAITSSGVVFGWLSQIEIAWKIFSSFTAVIAFILPFMEWSKKMQSTSGLIEKWSEIQSMYRTLLLEIPEMKSKQIKDEYKIIRDKEDKINASGINLPHDNEKLKLKCMHDVLKPYGIDEEEKNNGR